MYGTSFNCNDMSVLILLQRLLEANLATMNDSVDLLQAEIAKEEALLASEIKSFQEMEKNAKRAESERKRQNKNVCDGRILEIEWMLMSTHRNTRCFGSSMRFLKQKILPRPSLLF